jgi:hypothetical protein
MDCRYVVLLPIFFILCKGNLVVLAVLGSCGVWVGNQLPTFRSKVSVLTCQTHPTIDQTAYTDA